MHVFVSALLINLVTLNGVIIVAFSMTLPWDRKKVWGIDLQKLAHAMHILVIPSFAAGALLATCLFLIIPESMDLIAGSQLQSSSSSHHNRNVLVGSDDAGQVQTVNTLEDDNGLNNMDISWQFGSAFLGGYLLPLVLGFIFVTPHKPEDKCETCKQREAEMLRSKAVTNALQEATDIEHCCDDSEHSYDGSELCCDEAQAPRDIGIKGARLGICRVVGL